MRANDLMRDNDESKPFGAPRLPFRLDAEGDIVDADGWLICSPARDVWLDDGEHALAVCHALNRALR